MMHVLDEKNKGLFDSSTPLSITFKDAKKIDVQNPITANIISQKNANQIGEKGVKELFVRAEDEKIRRRLEALKRWDNEDAGEGGSGSSGPPRLPPPLPPQTLPSPPAFSPTRSPPTLDNLLNSEGWFFGTESLNDVRNDLWKLEKFEKDYSKPMTSLTDKTENLVEIIPKVKEN